MDVCCGASAAAWCQESALVVHTNPAHEVGFRVGLNLTAQNYCNGLVCDGGGAALFFHHASCDWWSLSGDQRVPKAATNSCGPRSLGVLFHI